MNKFFDYLRPHHGHHSVEAKLALQKFDQDELHILKKTWQDLSDRSNGKGIDKETFLQYFPLHGLLGERLFAQFDAHKRGYIDFDEFITGLATVCRGTMDDKIHFIFNMYDVSHDNTVSKQELSTLLNHVPREAFHHYTSPSGTMHHNRDSMNMALHRDLSYGSNLPALNNNNNNNGTAAAGGQNNAAAPPHTHPHFDETASDSDRSVDGNGGGGGGSSVIGSQATVGNTAGGHIGPSGATTGGQAATFTNEQLAAKLSEDINHWTNQDVVDRAFEDCDVNHEGRLTYEAFKMWVQRNPAIMDYIESILPYNGPKDILPHHHKKESLPHLKRIQSRASIGGNGLGGGGGGDSTPRAGGASSAAGHRASLGGDEFNGGGGMGSRRMSRPRLNTLDGQGGAGYGGPSSGIPGSNPSSTRHSQHLLPPAHGHHSSHNAAGHGQGHNDGNHSPSMPHSPYPSMLMFGGRVTSSTGNLGGQSGMGGMAGGPGEPLSRNSSFSAAPPTPSPTMVLASNNGGGSAASGGAPSLQPTSAGGAAGAAGSHMSMKKQTSQPPLAAATPTAVLAASLTAQLLQQQAQHDSDGSHTPLGGNGSARMSHAPSISDYNVDPDEQTRLLLLQAYDTTYNLELKSHLASLLEAFFGTNLSTAVQHGYQAAMSGSGGGGGGSYGQQQSGQLHGHGQGQQLTNEDTAYDTAVAMEDYLWKKGKSVFHLLSKRYYLLVGNCMYYYAHKSDIRVKGVIFLTGSIIATVKDIEMELRGYYGFEITHQDACTGEHHRHEKRVLYCKSEEDREHWVTSLQHSAHVVPIEDDYVIGKELGRGRFSVVCECVHKVTGKHCAVKIIDKTTIEVEEKSLLRTEIAVLKLVNHPNIIRLEGLYESKKYIYIVMEMLKGGELFERIVGRPRFTELEAAKLMRPLLESVAYLHDLGIVHRDLKPENILCGENLKDLKIADFGLSKMTLPKEKMDSACGTLSYVAPEVLTMQGYGKEADLWSVGVILFLLLCGKLPFDGDDHNEIIRSTIQGDLKVNQTVWNRLSDDAKSMITSLLNKNPKERISARDALKHPFIVTTLANARRNSMMIAQQSQQVASPMGGTAVGTVSATTASAAAVAGTSSPTGSDRQPSPLSAEALKAIAGAAQAVNTSSPSPALGGVAAMTISETPATSATSAASST